MTDLLNVENLVELHGKLEEFAKHHQNKGGQEAIRLLHSLKDRLDKDNDPRDGSETGMAYDQGFDAAFRTISQELHKRFVP